MKLLHSEADAGDTPEKGCKALGLMLLAALGDLLFLLGEFEKEPVPLGDLLSGKCSVFAILLPLECFPLRAQRFPPFLMRGLEAVAPVRL